MQKQLNNLLSFINWTLSQQSNKRIESHTDKSVLNEVMKTTWLIKFKIGKSNKNKYAKEKQAMFSIVLFKYRHLL